jgi:hypothetical protein
MTRSYFEHNARQPELEVVDGDPAEEPGLERIELASHGTKCRCRECRDDYGDWLYHSRLEPKED